jgi:regulator of protease activity HflC (stomatin/prohibitin superfamily)
MNNTPSPTKSQIKTAKIFIAIAVLVIAYMMFKPYIVVESGYVGVVRHFKAVTGKLLPEGLHMIMPIQTEVVMMNVRIQKLEADISASSKDLQNVTSKVALNYRLDPLKVDVVFKILEVSYEKVIIEPAIQESSKSTTAKFTAEELITKRSEVKNAILDDIQKRLSVHNIIVVDLSILDFSFSAEFDKAIEAKQIAEQSALTAKNVLARIEIEAQQRAAKEVGEALALVETAKARAESVLVEAKAQAEAQELLKENLTPIIIQLRMLEKWNGVLPQIMLKESQGMILDLTKLEKK